MQITNCPFFCRVRFHYGHPDIFDRIFHLTRGGISKASKTINLSEDIFSGNFYLKLTVRFLYLNFDRINMLRLQFDTSKGLCYTS